MTRMHAFIVGAMLALFVILPATVPTAQVVGTQAAGADVVINLGSFALSGGESSQEILVNLWGPEAGNTGKITSFTLDFDYVDGSSSADASDLGIEIESPFGEHGFWGGFNLVAPGAINMGHWPTIFGNSSTNSGHYTDTTNPFFMQSTGFFKFRAWNGWTNGPLSEYNNVTLTLHGSIVPTPSALAVLALAGLVGRRR